MQASSTVTQIEPLGEINDEQVKCFRLKHGDLEATVTSFGATLLSLKFKGKELTLNWDDLESLQDPSTSRDRPHPKHRTDSCSLDGQRAAHPPA